jgi:hypothetical protein
MQRLPGNVNVLQTEAERTRQLAQSFADLAAVIRESDPELWTGEAREAFLARRDTQAAQCQLAADTHARAGRALHDYVSVLDELQRHGSTGPEAHATLSLQRENAAREATAALRLAAEELAALRATLTEDVPPPPRIELTSVSAPTPIPPVPAPGHIAQVLDPHPMYSDRRRFDHNLQRICDAALNFYSG